MLKRSSLIQVYFPNVNPKYPNGGKMSQHLDKLSIGDSITFFGPKRHLEYKARGEFVIKKISREGTSQKRKVVKKVGMIAGKKSVPLIYGRRFSTDDSVSLVYAQVVLELRQCIKSFKQ